MLQRNPQVWHFETALGIARLMFQTAVRAHLLMCPLKELSMFRNVAMPLNEQTLLVDLSWKVWELTQIFFATGTLWGDSMWYLPDCHRPEANGTAREKSITKSVIKTVLDVLVPFNYLLLVGFSFFGILNFKIWHQIAISWRQISCHNYYLNIITYVQNYQYLNHWTEICSK